MQLQVKMLENGRQKIFKDKQATKNESLFSMLKCLRKDNNIVIRFCQQTTKIKCIYLALKTIKGISKMAQQWS